MTVRLPAPPARYDPRDQAELRRALEIALDRPTAAPSSGEGASLARDQFPVQVAAVESGATVPFTAVFIPVGICTRITTNHPCRLRIYATEADRTTDAPRVPGTDPDAGLVLLDVVTTPSVLTINLAPAAVLARPGSLYYCALHALADGVRDYSATLTILPLEV